MEDADQLVRLRRGIIGLRMQIALVKVLLRLKAGFRPDQPRVPRGNPDGGQWTDEWQGNETDFPTELPLIRVSHYDGDFPEVPEEPPPSTREKNGIAVSLARFLRAAQITFRATMAGQWLWDYAHLRINAYLEPTRSLEELKQAAQNPQPGYDVHHIVEQTRARRDGLRRRRSGVMTTRFSSRPTGIGRSMRGMQRRTRSLADCPHVNS